MSPAAVAARAAGLALATAWWPAAAQPVPQVVHWTPAVSVAPAGVTVLRGQVVRDDLAGSVSPLVIDPALDGRALPGALDGPRADGRTWFAADQSVIVGGVLAGPRRVVGLNPATPGTASLLFDLADMPDGAKIDAIASRDGVELLLSVDTAVALPGLPSVRPADVVRRDAAGAYALFFDATAAGIPDGIDLVGLEAAPDSRLIIVLDASFAPGGVAFGPGDLIAWQAGASPAWSLFYRPRTLLAGLDAVALRDVSVRFASRPDALLSDGFED